jgi:hypothetical protein
MGSREWNPTFGAFAGQSGLRAEAVPAVASAVQRHARWCVRAVRPRGNALHAAWCIGRFAKERAASIPPTTIGPDDADRTWQQERSIGPGIGRERPFLD